MDSQVSYYFLSSHVRKIVPSHFVLIVFKKHVPLVSVLIVGFTASQGRDFSLMIQSVGMTGASFLILVQKSELFLLEKYGWLVVNSVLFSLFGLIIGSNLQIPSFYVMCIYTTAVASFALILAYVEEYLQRQSGHSDEKLPESSEDGDLSSSTIHLSEQAQAHEDNNTQNPNFNEDRNSKNILKLLGNLTLAIFSLIGGIISSQIGTGADIMWFAYGSLIYNSRKKPCHRIKSNDLTAISIVVMTSTSIFGSIMRISTSGESAPTNEVYEALIACACIVIIGAPMGSLYLSAENTQKKLKVLFYALSFVQIASFGIIKIKDNMMAWYIVGGFLCSICLFIVAADQLVFKALHL